MGLYSLELWLLRLKKRKELDVVPILGLLVFLFELVWIGVILFPFVFDRAN